MWNIAITCIVRDVVTMFWTSVMTKNEMADVYKLREESCRIVRVDLKHEMVSLTQELVVAMMASVTTPAAGEVTEDIKIKYKNTI